MKSLLLTGLAAVAIMGAVYADQSKTQVVVPVEKTTPVSGKQMYVSYCAPCHGVDGKGNGPVASAFRQPPTNLTVLSRNNNGKYPADHVITVLQYGAPIPSHGTAEMPVWGPIFGSMSHSQPSERMLRISNLNRYLETIQVK
ncbi:MAG: c-type cytochrome [Terracidiphilus sp.]